MSTDLSSERILVCGGTGFVGQSLIERLVQEKRKVRIFVYEDCLPPRLQKLEDNIENFPGNILKKESLEPVLEGIDCVVNLIGSFFNDLYDLNIRASYNLLEACKRKDIKRIIYTSSETVYSDDSDKPPAEADTPKPQIEYALTKYVAECLYRLYSEDSHVPSIMLRMANIYGPGQTQGVIYNFTSSLLQGLPVIINNDGMQKRGFLYVNDAVDGIVKALDYDCKEKFDIFNISGGEPITLNDLVSLIGKVTGRMIETKHVNSDKPDIRCLWSSHEKAKNALGYEPKTPLEEGIRKTYEYLASSLGAGDK